MRQKIFFARIVAAACLVLLPWLLCATPAEARTPVRRGNPARRLVCDPQVPPRRLARAIRRATAHPRAFADLASHVGRRAHATPGDAEHELQGDAPLASMTFGDPQAPTLVAVDRVVSRGDALPRITGGARRSPRGPPVSG